MKRALLIIGMFLLIFVSSCDYLKNKELSPEKKLELAQKCSEAGKSYFNHFSKEYDDLNAQPRWLWDEPEYHYSSTVVN